MKRTTYIFIGVFCANIILVLGMWFYIKSILQDNKPLIYNFDLVQSSGNVDLSDVHTLEFIVNGADSENFYFTKAGQVLLTSSDNEEKSVMSYPTSEYLKLDKRDGVLTVKLDIPPTEMVDGRSRAVALDNLIFNVETAKTLKKVYSGTGFDVILKEVELDSLCLDSKNSQLYSCIVRSLVLDGNMRLKGESSQINDLYIDLDKVDRWDIKESKINTLHLTGSRQHQNRLSADQYNRLVWEPKGEGAELKMTLKGKSEIIMN